MDDDWLVEYYRQKLLERYTACVNRDSRLKISDMLRTVDVETLDTIIQFLELKKQEGAQMPKNSNNASVPTTDAPRSSLLQKEALSIIMRMSDEQVQKLMQEFTDTEIPLTRQA